MVSHDEIKESIVEEGKMTAQEFDYEVKKKIDEMQGIISETGAAMIISNNLKMKVDLNPVMYKRINELKNGDDKVQIVGTIVHNKNITFWNTCPECNKKLKEEDNVLKCEAHGTISNPKSGYVYNIYLDDGSSETPLRVVLFSRQLQALTGKSNEEIVACKENEEKLEEINNAVLGKLICMRGTVKESEYGKEMTARLVLNDHKDVSTTIAKLPKKEEDKKTEAAPAAPSSPEPVTEPKKSFSGIKIEKTPELTPASELNEETLNEEDLNNL